MDHNQQGQAPGRRPLHRGRRGPDRRGPERRPQSRAQEQPSRSDVDVEQIMRDIRARIAERHGVDLSHQQIQELAARRLESILDPRGIKPALLDQLRKAAGTPAEPPTKSAEAPYVFEDNTLYESHRGLMRFIRSLLNPILKLFFNPNPLIRALNIQARLNAEAVAREAERDRRQTEWNALHYELLHRVVSEIARVTIEAQGISTRVESLSAKVDFNERRVRGVEGVMHQPRPTGRRETREPRDVREVREVREVPEVPETAAPFPVVVPPADAAPATSATSPEAAAAHPGPGPAHGQGPPSDGTRRRRRRRRGRRGTGVPGEAGPDAADTTATDISDAGDTADVYAEAETEADGPTDIRASDAGLDNAAIDEPAAVEASAASEPQAQRDLLDPVELVADAALAGDAQPVQEAAPEEATVAPPPEPPDVDSTRR